MTARVAPSRGDVWMVDLNPVRGHEQSGMRPAVIVSVDPLNHSPAGIVIIAPVTSKEKGIPFHVRLERGEGGMTKRSFIKCEDVRSVSVERLARRLGSIPPETMATVEDRLRILMGV